MYTFLCYQLQLEHALAHRQEGGDERGKMAGAAAGLSLSTGGTTRDCEESGVFKTAHLSAFTPAKNALYCGEALASIGRQAAANKSKAAVTVCCSGIGFEDTSMSVSGNCWATAEAQGRESCSSRTDSCCVHWFTDAVSKTNKK